MVEGILTMEELILIGGYRDIPIASGRS